MIQSIFCLVPILILFFWNIKVAKPKELYDNYMSLDNIQNIRGILAILIVIHHFSGMLEVQTVFSAFNHIGYLVVAVFLFISGYGLAYGIKYKPGYLKGARFLYTRIPKLIIPYWLTVVLYAVGFFISDMLYDNGKSASLKDILVSFVSYKNIIVTSWYIFELIILYFVFFVVFKIKNRRIAVFSLFCAVGICAIIFYFSYEFTSVWYRSIFAFPLGVVYSLYQDKIEALFSRKIMLSYCAVFVLFAFLLLSKYLCIVLNLKYLQVIFDIMSSGIFALMLILLFRKIRLGNRVLYFLGGISYEIYLVHYLVVNFVYHYYFVGQVDIVLYFAISLGLTVLIAWILNGFDKYLIGLYTRIVQSKK